jgi:predicted alpha/beta-hydrolase family hydrolase
MLVRDIPTPVGPARLHLERPDGAAGLLLLGHGAGGGVSAPDLRSVAAVAVACGLAVGLVEQPYRVAGRRAPAPAVQLDAAFTAVAAAARRRAETLITGGRSSGARVACRTTAATGAVAVLALAFPLRPPRRPDRSRLPELAAAGVPCLVVQGEGDAFGSAAELAAQAPPGVTVLPAAGADHALRRGIDLPAVAAWLRRAADSSSGAGTPAMSPVT